MQTILWRGRHETPSWGRHGSTKTQPYNVFQHGFLTRCLCVACGHGHVDVDERTSGPSGIDCASACSVNSRVTLTSPCAVRTLRCSRALRTPCPVRALQMPSFPHSRPAGIPLRGSHVPVNGFVKLMSELCYNGGTVCGRAIHIADFAR
jgi:hypothetical protein